MSSLTDGAWPHPSGGLCKMYVLQCVECGYKWSQFIRFKAEDDVVELKCVCHKCNVEVQFRRLVASRRTA